VSSTNRFGCDTLSTAVDTDRPLAIALDTFEVTIRIILNNPPEFLQIYPTENNLVTFSKHTGLSAVQDKELNMKRISTKPKMLLCTVYRRYADDYMDLLGEVILRSPRITMLRKISPGLRFIKQNVPEVEILEYPLWHEYQEKLKEGWDIVGFSFYQHEIDEIIQMAAEARRQGVKELWAGNYGALDYKVPGIVDKVVLGPGEDQVARVFGYNVQDEDIEHPPMMFHIALSPGNIRHFTYGVLYTRRGCPFKCTFCQTPVFDNRNYSINIESIDRVLQYYRQKRLKYIFVIDELFGADPRSTDRLTQLLAKYKFHWYIQSRASLVLRHLDDWYDRGLRLPSIGVEAMSQRALDGVNKKQKTEEIIEYARRTGEKKYMYSIGYYMLGYQNMTADESIQDAMYFKQMGFNIHSVNVITPFPKTMLWEELDSKYGIFDHSYRHYDAKHLVWNHPHIQPDQMTDLYKTIVGFLNKPVSTYMKGILQMIREGMQENGISFLWKGILDGPVNSMGIDERSQFFFPNLRMTHQQELQN